MALTTVALVKEAMQTGELYTDEQVEPAVNTAIDLIEFYVTAEAFLAEPPALQTAALSLAVDIFQNSIAPGGSVMSPDMTVTSPYRLGRSIISRYQGLIAPYWNAGGIG